MKKETLSVGSVFFCMSLYTSFCDVTTRYMSIFQPYQQSPFHLFWGRGHIDLRERIFALDGAFALTFTWFRLYTSSRKWSPIRWHHNGFRPQYWSFLCTSALRHTSQT